MVADYVCGLGEERKSGPMSARDSLCVCRHTAEAHDEDGCNYTGCVCGKFREVIPTTVIEYCSVEGCGHASVGSVDGNVLCCFHWPVSQKKDEEHRVIHPSRYQSKSGIEVWDITDAFDLNFNLGNALKYLLWADKKGTPIEDLKKAANYINHEIERREK